MDRNSILRLVYFKYFKLELMNNIYGHIKEIQDTKINKKASVNICPKMLHFPIRCSVCLFSKYIYNLGMNEILDPISLTLFVCN